MTEMRIVDIRLKPWWKFWQIDNFEITLEDDKGNRKTVRIHKTLESYDYISKLVFMEFVGYKYCTGDQFWGLNRRMKKREKEEKPSKDEIFKKYASELVGESFDCAVILSEEE